MSIGERKMEAMKQSVLGKGRCPAIAFSRLVYETQRLMGFQAGGQHTWQRFDAFL